MEPAHSRFIGPVLVEVCTTMREDSNLNWVQLHRSWKKGSLLFHCRTQENGEVVNSNDGKGCASSLFREGANEVYFSFGKLSGANDHIEALERLFLNIGEPLALVTFLNKLARILFQGWPKVALFKHFIC